MGNHAAASEFAGKNSIPETQLPLLNGLIDFLKERGQFVEKGDLQKQFIESRTVTDAKGIKIKVNECVVCGNETYEVQPPG